MAAFLAPFYVFLSVLLWRARHRFEFQIRKPTLLFMLLFWGAIYDVGIFVSRLAMVNCFTPFLWSLISGGICCGMYFYRCAYLLFRYEIGRDLKRASEDPTNYQPSFYVKYRSYLQWPRLLIGMFLEVLLISLLIFYKESVRQVPYSTPLWADECDLETLTSYAALNGLFFIHILGYIVFAYKLQHFPRDGLYLKQELKYTALAALATFLLIAACFGLSSSVGYLPMTFAQILPPPAMCTVMIPYVLYKINQGGNKQTQQQSITLEDVVSSEEGMSMFHNFLRLEFSSENLEFWRAAESWVSEFEGSDGDGDWRSEAGALLGNYLIPNSPFEVNLPNRLRAEAVQIQALIDGMEPASVVLPQVTELIKHARTEIFHLMTSDSFQRFSRKPEFESLTVAILKRRGSPTIVSPPELSSGTALEITDRHRRCLSNLALSTLSGLSSNADPAPDLAERNLIAGNVSSRQAADRSSSAKPSPDLVQLYFTSANVGSSTPDALPQQRNSIDGDEPDADIEDRSGKTRSRDNSDSMAAEYSLDSGNDVNSQDDEYVVTLEPNSPTSEIGPVSSFNVLRDPGNSSPTIETSDSSLDVTMSNLSS
eukprot:gb/GEZN01004733.1/.p1 GENE.gb/GEZN01004733.1/~~gb/GEZN01004733.1/.p1  ORF type:complete len:619 (-),score=58.25 gb/GEZN01004733.1/:57-1844(-)